ncbi:MAG TPA: hypothetical protein DCE44_08470, partial [Verrucomicrobiales bacterium]|nr:hypothetical protein [Verrucomicrobiales bacterium]
MNSAAPTWRVVLACGGTGGHLFPGLAVADELSHRGANVTLVISPKEVDQQGIRAVAGRFEVITLPVVAFSLRRTMEFGTTLWQAHRHLRDRFAQQPPDAVLAMGGFLSATPILAGRRAGALTFLHESNTIPGRANRWLARLATECFVGLKETVTRLSNRNVSVTGTPVRAEIRRAITSEARRA